MEELGYLWQTDTISPAHEHFITYLIKQKLLSLTEQIQSREATKTERVYVLYLPLNEIHELGLMYLNYEFLDNGYKTIYLGESVPIESLVDIKNYFDKITFVSYLTVEPTVENLPDYIQKIENDLLKDTNHELMVLGRLSFEVNRSTISEKVKVYHSISDCILNL